VSNWEAMHNVSIPRTCPKCNCNFVADIGSRVYCSDECRLGCVCVHCGKSFQKTTNTKGLYCSTDCHYKHKRELATKICVGCQKPFYTATDAKACSRECGHLGKKLRNANRARNCKHCGCDMGLDKPAKQRFCDSGCSSAHRGVWSEDCPIGTRREAATGYYEVKTKKGWVSEHRHVMEVKLNRKLQPGESVHHLNGHKSDNRPENLELWYSATQHGSHHPGQRMEDLIAQAVENMLLCGVQLASQELETVYESLHHALHTGKTEDEIHESFEKRFGSVADEIEKIEQSHTEPTQVELDAMNSDDYRGEIFYYLRAGGAVTDGDFQATMDSLKRFFNNKPAEPEPVQSGSVA
jgi:hypothetical protein